MHHVSAFHHECQYLLCDGILFYLFIFYFSIYSPSNSFDIYIYIKKNEPLKIYCNYNFSFYISSCYIKSLNIQKGKNNNKINIKK